MAQKISEIFTQRERKDYDGNEKYITQVERR
jgi:hypothetical protein